MIKKLVVLLSAISLVACDNTPQSRKEDATKTPQTKKAAAEADVESFGDIPAVPPPERSAVKKRPTDDQVIGHDVVIVPAPASRPQEKPSTTASTANEPVFATPGKPSTLTPSTSEGDQCAEPYRETRPEWAPGLPYPPAETPVLTDTANDASIRFTDARRDELFAVAMERANAVPKEMKEANQQFAKQIRDIKISIDHNQTREVKVKLMYQYRMQKEVFELRGVLEKPLNVSLVNVPRPGAAKDAPVFGGVLTCTDADRGCKNILLRLDLKSESGKIARTAYIVHRWGEANIFMSDTDRRQFARVPNQNQSAFLEYVSNSLNNACLRTLADIKANRREAPLCAQERLQAQCGSEDAKKPAARAFGLRSWAIAYGRSAFELTMTPKEYDGVADIDQKRIPYLTVRGPLAHNAKSTPAYAHPLIVSGEAKGLNEVYLMKNDGQGNLNLRFDFGAAQDEKSRISVSSLLPNTAYSQSVVQAAQSSPIVPQSDVEHQDLVSQE